MVMMNSMRMMKMMKTNKKLHKFRICVGDIGGDGHEKKEYYELQATKSPKQIETLYKALCKKLKFGFDKFCTKYDDTFLTEKQLIQLGLNPDDFEIWNGRLEIYSYDDFIDLWIDFMNTHHPELELDYVPNDIKDYYLNLGGYGIGCL